MSTQNLLKDEKIILFLEKSPLVLTNQRVKYEVVSQSSSIYESIPIDKISICKSYTLAYPILLILAAIAFLTVFMASNGGEAAGSIIAAILLVLAYFGSKKALIEIFSDSGKSIALPANDLKHDEIRKFLEAVALQYQTSKSDSA